MASGTWNCFRNGIFDSVKAKMKIVMKVNEKLLLCQHCRAWNLTDTFTEAFYLTAIPVASSGNPAPKDNQEKMINPEEDFYGE